MFLSVRFIPTDVGNSPNIQTLTPYHPVHPHGRGELFSAISCNNAFTGSSPRTWGTHHILHVSQIAPGFIPTDVGNSSSVVASGIADSVHPHGRGELPLWRDRCWRRYGSSPRTWGTQARLRRQRGPLRFIPTDVGNSSGLTAILGIVKVHPHGRGELCVINPMTGSPYGSSPRTWGTHSPVISSG